MIVVTVLVLRNVMYCVSVTVVLDHGGRKQMTKWLPKLVFCLIAPSVHGLQKPKRLMFFL